MSSAPGEVGANGLEHSSDEKCCLPFKDFTKLNIAAIIRWLARTSKMLPLLPFALDFPIRATV